jgi:hypothetical protein
MGPDVSADRIINAKVHWSVRERVGKLGLVDETKYRKYGPKNLPKDYPIAEKSKFEQGLVDMCRANREHSKTDEERGRTMHCVLHRELTKREQGWRGRRLRKLREEWKDVLAAHNPGPESSA